MEFKSGNFQCRKTFKGAEGFTLIELLIVIAILAILAALVYPGGSSDKARAIKIVCLNNLKQIGYGVRMYSDDSADASPSLGPAAAATNTVTLYSGYKQLMKSYLGLKGASSPQDRLFACPADKFFPDFVTNSPGGTWQNIYVRQSLHNQPAFDYSSYAFNGGDNITRMVGPIAVNRPGLANIKLSSVKNPARTVLVAEASALVPWSWHEPSPKLWFNDAKNAVSFVDGHVSYVKIYWDATPLPGGGISFALAYDPPASYDYQWSGN